MLPLLVLRRQIVMPLLFLFLITLLSAPAFAVVYNVNNTTDGNALNQLRGAIVAADGAGPGPHTINVAAGTYTLTLGQITFGNNPQTISIIGAGSATTIIQMTGPVASRDRIFFINPTGTTNSPIISVSGFTFQGGYLNSDPYGGAAICAGGGSAESLTITNSVFQNNTLPAGAYGGAAVNMQVRGNLSIDNSTFTNNVSNDADGGAVLFILFGSTVGTPYGTLSVTNSTFTGNSVIFPGAGTSNGGALAFTAQAGTTPYNVTVNNNTFINNTADGLGGAISANNSANVSVLQVHYNRFVGNASAAGTTSSGLHFVESSGSVNAENNWWGCSAGPTTSPCDRAGGDVAGGGSLDADPWLQLRTTASPSSIVTNQTSPLTASFLLNSAGGAVTLPNLNRLIGLPVTWSSLGGGLSAQQTTIQAAGTATATYSETSGVAGTHSGTAVVDNGPASGSVNTAAITVNKANTTAAITTNLTTPTVTGQSYTVAYTVTGAFGNSPTAPSGNVQVSDGSQTCTGTVAAGSCSLTSTTAGAKTITATYQGNANFNGSPASPGISHTVNKADTTVAVTSNANASVFGQSINLTATITVTSPGAGSPTGNITFKDNNVNIGTCTAQTVAASVATCAISTLSVATHPITATYNSDANFNASPASPILNQVVNKASTTTGVTSSQNPSLTGQSVTFTATVAVTAPGAGTPTGNVNFLDGGVSITGCSAVALSGTTAQCVTSALTTASHTITATYGGDGSFNASPAGSMTGNPQVVSNTAVWDGSASTDWNTAANWTTNAVPSATNDVSLPSSGVTNQPNLSAGDTTVSTLVVGANRTLTIGGGRTLTVTGTLTMNGNNIDATAGTIEIASGASVTRTSGVVLGNMRKNYVLGNIAPESPAAIFTYPVGTATGFSPVTVNATGASTGSLTVAALNGTAPSTPASPNPTTLNRYWQLTETGDVNADLTFNYLEGDVDAGTESNYRLIRSYGAGVRPLTFLNIGACPGVGTTCVDTTANTIFQAGVVVFDGFWTAGAAVSPTAANVGISGRVLDFEGRGLARSRIELTDQSGNVTYAFTNAFGYYRFVEVSAGQAYVLTVANKRYQFAPRLVTTNADLTEVIFEPIGTW